MEIYEITTVVSKSFISVAEECLPLNTGGTMYDVCDCEHMFFLLRVTSYIYLPLILCHVTRNFSHGIYLWIFCVVYKKQPLIL